MSPSPRRRRISLLTVLVLALAALGAAAIARAAATATFTSGAAAPAAGPHALAFDATGSTGDGFAWDFGPGTGSGPTVTHVFPPGPATRSVQLTVTDSAGTPETTDDTTDDETKQVEVPNADPAQPSLGITTPGPFRTGKEISFTTSSTDADGDGLIYSWDFEDGGPAAGGTSPKRTFAVPGDYDILVRVRDGYGGTATRERTITVQNEPQPPRPPIASIKATPGSAKVNQVIQFETDASDPDPGDAATLTYRWNFGDGTTSDKPDVGHAYSPEGTYFATLTVRDRTGLQSVAELPGIRVTRDPDPENGLPGIKQINGPGGKVAVNQPVKLSAEASDPDGDRLSYRWDFGDGVSSDLTEPTHAWSTPGYKIVQLAVADGRGGSAVRPTLIQVTGGDPPKIEFSFEPGRPKAGQRVRFMATGDDPDGKIVRFTWDLNGDDRFGNGEGPFATWTYKKPERLRVSLRVQDDDGIVVTRTKTLRVQRAAPPPQISPIPEVFLSYQSLRRGARVRALTIRTPRGTWARVSCSGRGCPFGRALTKRQRRRGRDRSIAFPGAKRFFRAGNVFQIRVISATRTGKIVTYRFRGRYSRAHKFPNRCAAPKTGWAVSCPK